MPTAFKYLRDAIKAKVILVPTTPLFTTTNVKWKKIPAAREGETVPRIDLVPGDDWHEPFTAEDDAAWLGHYIVHVIIIEEADVKRHLNDVKEENRQLLKKSLLDIPGIQAQLDIATGVEGQIVLDDVKVSRRKIHNTSSLRLDYDLQPLTFEFILQESRTGIY